MTKPTEDTTKDIFLTPEEVGKAISMFVQSKYNRIPVRLSAVQYSQSEQKFVCIPKLPTIQVLF